MSEEAVGFGSALGSGRAQGAQPGVGTLPLPGHGVVWPQGGWRGDCGGAGEWDICHSSMS